MINLEEINEVCNITEHLSGGPLSRSRGDLRSACSKCVHCLVRQPWLFSSFCPSPAGEDGGSLLMPLCVSEWPAAQRHPGSVQHTGGIQDQDTF